MRRTARWLFPVLALVFWFGAEAFAYQFGTLTREADVKQAADPRAATVAHLPRGSIVTASDRATNGYYRVRASNGALGYLSADALALRPAPGSRRQVSRGGGEKFPRFTVKALFSLDLWTMSALDPVYGTGNMADGSGFGGEFGYWFSPKFGILIRVEDLSKQVSGTDSTTGINYNVNVSALPIMIGAEYGLITSPGFSLYAGAFGGTSSPKLKSVGTCTSTSGAPCTSEGQSDETDVSGSAMAFLIKLEGDLNISRAIGFFGEVGYRIMSTSAITPSPVGAITGGNFDQGGSSPVPVSLNFGGPELSLGIKLAF